MITLVEGYFALKSSGTVSSTSFWMAKYLAGQVLSSNSITLGSNVKVMTMVASTIGNGIPRNAIREQGGEYD